ncbi:MFS transporter [Candidatus Pantoea edessiphila]|uniref:MFS transporter n=1 Tax=Candidatus Pantoea edessiphila TaxID=2044610 RepID=A0A2P5SXI6_9GAMM|nr:MFS transporter [Candidatus Pantoea edessiphila]MBK4775792.1 MFS transporter [Pantoea sp. Edef]PPI87051.1 MFS transporter [Candidatus Pantoea edessiphila]
MKDKKLNTTELRTSVGLGIVFSLRMLGMFMVLPVLTTYGMLLQHANKTLIGIAIGIYGFTQAIFQIPFGLISDRVGRKPMIIFGLSLLMVGSLISANSNSIWSVIIGRALQGSGAISAVIMALLSDLTREQNLSKVTACIGINFGITFAIAIIISPIVTNAFGLHSLFWIIAFLSIICFFIVIYFVPIETNHKFIINREIGVVQNSFFKVLRNYKLIKLNISIFCLHTLLMCILIVLPHQFELLGIPISNHWKIYLITMLIAFASVIPIIIFTEINRFTKQVFLIGIMTILIAEILLHSFLNYFWTIIIGLQLFLIAFSLLEAIIPSWVSKESPLGYKGTAMGFYSTSQFLGVAFGSSIGGWIFGHFDAQAVFLYCILVSVVWLIICLNMSEPLYIISMRIKLNDKILAISNLEQKIKQQKGVFETLIIPEEKSLYIKIDNKLTDRSKIEKFLNCL